MLKEYPRINSNLYKMEPSLKSSSMRVKEVRLRKAEQPLHETTQRFVESLSKDNRVSQYADLNFAIKKLQENPEPWYLLDALAGGRSGYLVFLPRQPIVWIDEQFKMAFRIPMRVSAHIYEKKTVLIASLNRNEGILRLEDAWMLSGVSLKNAGGFSKRWDKLCEFYSTFYKPDLVLQGGMSIEIAEYHPLTYVKEITSNLPTMILAQPETYPRRFRVQFAPSTPVPSTPMPPRPAALVKTKAPALLPTPSVPPSATAQEDNSLIVGEVVAIAVAHPEYPDTYNIMYKGKKKGFAAVQDLALSKRLRSAVGVKKEVSVKVQWNSEFDMLEILSVIE